jgi:hypothetical protein
VFPRAEAKAVLLGAQRCHLVGEVLDPLQKYGAVEGWTNAHERRLECDLLDDVHTAGCGVEATLGLAGGNACTLGGSRLDQMVRRKSSGTTGARLLRCLRNWDSSRSPISSSVRSCRMRCLSRGTTASRAWSSAWCRGLDSAER